MTLLVGIRCSDGVVVGADAAATLGSPGMPTIQQPVPKLQILDGKIIVGVAGAVGLAQRITAEIKEMWDTNKLSGMKPFQAMAAIRLEIFNKHISPEIQAATIAKNLYGQAAMQGATSHTLAAMPIQLAPCLFQFDQQGSPEEASPTLPFVCVGSGAPLADPFLAFLKRIFWSERGPTVPEGVFAAVWALDHVIETNPGGVNGPIQIAVLEKPKKDWVARFLPDDDLAEHREARQAAEQSLKDFRSQVGGGGAGSGDDSGPPAP